MFKVDSYVDIYNIHFFVDVRHRKQNEHNLFVFENDKRLTTIWKQLISLQTMIFWDEFILNWRVQVELIKARVSSFEVFASSEYKMNREIFFRQRTKQKNKMILKKTYMFLLYVDFCSFIFELFCYFVQFVKIFEINNFTSCLHNARRFSFQIFCQIIRSLLNSSFMSSKNVLITRLLVSNDLA